MPSAMQRLAAPFAAALLCLALAACAGQTSAARDAELERETIALRARVERLENEAATERARLATDIAAMREDMRALRLSLEEAARSMALLSGQEGGQTGAPKAAQPGKSPRQALRESLRGVMELSREALERLNQELDRQLAQPPKPEKPARPE